MLINKTNLHNTQPISYNSNFDNDLLYHTYKQTNTINITNYTQIKL